MTNAQTIRKPMISSRRAQRALLAAGALSSCVWLAACGNTPCDPESGVICTSVGLGSAGFSGDGADAQDAELYLPMDVTVGPDGRLFVVDWNNHRIRAVNAEGVIETVAGSGLLGDGPVGPALEGDFNHPTNVIFDPQGRMWIAAWHNSRIRRVDFTTGMLEDVCGTGGRSYNGDEGPALTAVLDLPAGIAFDPDGNLLFVDQANQVIRRIIEPMSGTGTIERVAGQCLVDACGADEVPTLCPGSQKYSCTMASNPAACSGPCQPGFSGDGGPALEARFAMPFGQSADPAGRLALDAAGNMYLADTRNHRIRRIGTDGVVSTIAGTGEAGFAGDGGPAIDAELNNPVDIDVAGDGTIYFTDTFNSCVRAIAPDGALRTVAGVCGTRGETGDDGPAGEALLDRPYGIDLDGDLLYIADTHNHRIRLVRL